MKNIPNILSMIRILMIPFFVYFALSGFNVEAGIILVLSGATDMLDGFLARRFGWITDLGKVLDPAADKLTQITVYIICFFNFERYRTIFAVLILKDIIMLVLGFGLFKKGVQIQGARWFGKIATIAFYVAMAAILFFPGMPEIVEAGLVVIVLICVLLAAVLYIPEYLKYQKEVRKHN